MPSALSGDVRRRRSLSSRFLAKTNCTVAAPADITRTDVSEFLGQPLSERGVRKMVAKYLKASGITKKISPHSLRHTFATYKAERGASPYVLRE